MNSTTQLGLSGSSNCTVIKSISTSSYTSTNSIATMLTGSLGISTGIYGGTSTITYSPSLYTTGSWHTSTTPSIIGTSYPGGITVAAGTGITISSGYGVTTGYYDSKICPFLFCEEKLIPGKLYRSKTAYLTYSCKFTDADKNKYILENQKNYTTSPIMFIKEIVEYKTKNYIFATNKLEYLVFIRPEIFSYGSVVVLEAL